MLVEDDNNLREIYGARLLAEGYEIVSAKDGEEALALAVKEKPDLIISDIMMPKISGFDMLDILRSTAETKNTKVIMMTALSQVEDKDRADRLGADRYLIKSQVTLEDVAKAAREVLGGDEQQGVVNPSASEPEPVVVDTPTPTPLPANIPTPTAVPIPVATPPVPEPAPVAPAPSQVIPTPAPTPTPTNIPTPTAVPIPVATPPVQHSAAPVPAPDNTQVLADTIAAMGGTPSTSSDPTSQQSSSVQPNVMAPGEISKTSVHTKVINPINDISEAGSNLQELLAAEEAKEATTQSIATAVSEAPATPVESPTPEPAQAPTPMPVASSVVVNDLTPPEVLQKQAEEAAEEAAETTLQPPAPIEPTA